VLILHLRRRIQFWPPLRIRIPASIKDTVEEILKRAWERPTGFRSVHENGGTSMTSSRFEQVRNLFESALKRSLDAERQLRIGSS
jgi:hypothetical protein